MCVVVHSVFVCDRKPIKISQNTLQGDPWDPCEWAGHRSWVSVTQYRLARRQCYCRTARTLMPISQNCSKNVSFKTNIERLWPQNLYLYFFNKTVEFASLCNRLPLTLTPICTLFDRLRLDCQYKYSVMNTVQYSVFRETSSADFLTKKFYIGEKNWNAILKLCNSMCMTAIQFCWNIGRVSIFGNRPKCLSIRPSKA